MEITLDEALRQRGGGWKKASVTWRSKIPAGAKRGPGADCGRGFARRGRRPGDLYLVVKLMEHPKFKLRAEGPVWKRMWN